MSIDLSFANNTLATYVYEPFSYTISNPGSYTITISNSSGIPPGYLVNNGTEVIFSTSSNAMGVGTESFTLTASQGGTVVATSSNTVNVNAGRFLDAEAPGGAPYDGRIFTFYKNEPITPLPLVAPFAISTPTSVPTLPPGLTYTSNASNTFSITGTPLATVPQSNYLIIGRATGSNLGKIITSKNVGISVSNERVLMNLTGSSIVSPMTVDSAISPRTITAQFPPYPSGGTLRYTWTGLPDGISVVDSSGNNQPSPFTPSDSNYTLTIQGAPSINAANAYRNAGISSNTVTFIGTRTNPLPVISNTLPITFRFGETVLFDPITVPTLYSGVAVPSGSISFRAATYFSTGSLISNIFSPDLRSDLSLTFVPGVNARADLSGIPLVNGSANYTIRAINSNGTSRDLSVPITVASDTVTFDPPTPSSIDTCFNFVLSRPISLSLSGYYTSNIQFRASAASGNPITFSTSSFTGTGLSLSNIDSNTVQLVGTPESVRALSTATITASAVGTPATATTSFKFAILNDDISFSQPSATQLSFIQNRAITPIQLTATTLSERQVISFTSANLPSGLSISTTGLISGTPAVDTSGSFTVTGSTGYMSENQVYSYDLTPDSIILIERPQPSYALTLGGPIPAAKVSGLSYSGIAVTNFLFDSFPVTYGLTIDSSTGVFGGTFTTSLPPDDVLPSNVNFSVQGSAGTLTANLPVEINTSNAPQYRWFILKDNIIANTASTLNNWSIVFQSQGELSPSLLPFSSYTDYSIRTIDVNTRSILGVTNTTAVTYSPDGSNFTDFFLPITEYPPQEDPPIPTAFYEIGPSAIVRSGSNVYGVGYNTAEGDLNLATGFWTSQDDGQTWTSNFPLLASGEAGLTLYPGAFIKGNLITYKNGVFLIGAPTGIDTIQPPTARSSDGGITWAAVPSGMKVSVMSISTDASRWIMAGSDDYISGGDGWRDPPGDSRTLRYSDDDGETWTLVTSGDFNLIAEHVIYGNSIWIAGGYHYDSGSGNTYYALRYSSDGLVWSSFSLPGTQYPSSSGTQRDYLDAILYDGTSYIVFTTRDDDGSIIPRAFTHAADGSSLSSGWTLVTMTTLLALGNASSRATRPKGRFLVATLPPEPILFFPDQTGSGPIVTSPTNTSILLYQYAPMSPITFTATGTGRIYFFVQDVELPRGLSFNSVTNTLSGTPMLIGEYSMTIYVKDDIGVTLLTLGIRVIIPTVTRQQTSAGAWTSLIRQYTIVNAAQNSVNGKTLPATEPPLGEFMRPYPPDSVHEDPICKKC